MELKQMTWKSYPKSENHDDTLPDKPEIPREKCYHRGDLWADGTCNLARCNGCSFEGDHCDNCTHV